MLQPINQEQVAKTLQVVLAYLEDPTKSTPNPMLEGIVSGKSLLKGILSGGLVICELAPPGADKKDVATKKTPRKKKAAGKRQPTG